jgi:lipopolysaccharide export system permease protein
MMPFCIQIGAMTCYLSLSRKLELVVVRAAGVSAWQFVTPAVIGALLLGVAATTLYNPMSANLAERSKQMEQDILSGQANLSDAVGFWINQSTNEGQAVINAFRSQLQGQILIGLSIFRFDPSGAFIERIEAGTGQLQKGNWVLKDARRYTLGAPPVFQDTTTLATNLTPAQVRNSVATPETVSFWQLPEYIQSSEDSGFTTAAYRLQYQKLLSRPFLLASMVLLAAAVSLRLFRFGGVQKMVLGGIAAGFLLYVLSKVTEDLSKAELMNPIAAAWLPVLVGGLSGFMALLYQEDG